MIRGLGGWVGFISNFGSSFNVTSAVVLCWSFSVSHRFFAILLRFAIPVRLCICRGVHLALSFPPSVLFGWRIVPFFRLRQDFICTP